MALGGIIDRLCEPQRQRVDSIEQSLAQHLQALLNDKQGSLVDGHFQGGQLAELVRDIPNSVPRMTKQIKALIARHETRLHQIFVHPLQQGESPGLSLQIRACLQGTEPRAVSITAELNAQGAFKVWAVAPSQQEVPGYA